MRGSAWWEHQECYSEKGVRVRVGQERPLKALALLGATLPLRNL